MLCEYNNIYRITYDKYTKEDGFIMSHKNEKSGKIQLFFFTCVPSILAYVAAILFALSLKMNLLKSAVTPFIVIAALWSVLGGFIIAANLSLIKKVGDPSSPVLKIKISEKKLEASLDMSFSTAQMFQFAVNVFFTVIFTIPVALFGWLMFIMYARGKFLKKLSKMAYDCDRADDIIAAQSGTVEEIAKYFYLMLDYVAPYKKLGEKKGANQMLGRAEKLLNLWERLYGEE